MSGRQDLPRWLRADDLVNTPYGHGHIVDFSRVPPDREWVANVQMGTGDIEQFAVPELERVMRDRADG